MKTIRANVLGASHEPDGELIEKVMTKKDIKKRDEIADAISDKEMEKRYGDKNVKYAIATKSVMDSKKKKKEEMKEELDKKDKPFVKKLIKNLKKGSKTHKKQAEKLEKAMKENTAIESELVIQDWNSDDIKFTEIETVDIIKAKPLKESTDWRLELSEKFGFVKNLGKLKLGKQLIKGTKPLSKLKSTVKVPKGFTKFGAITPFRTDPLTSIKPQLGKNAFKTPLTQLKDKAKANELIKKKNLQKLKQKYDVQKTSGEPPKKIQKRYITKPKLPNAVSKDDMIMPKKGEAQKTQDLINKLQSDKIKKSKIDIDSEKKILDAKLDKKAAADARQDDAINYLTKQGVNLSAKPPKPVDKLPTPAVKPPIEKPKGSTSTKSNNILTSKKVKDAAKAGTFGVGMYALGRMDEKDAQNKKRFKDVGSEEPKASEGSSEVKPVKPIGKPDLKSLTKKKTVMASYDWRAELGEDWQKVNRQDKTDGLSKKAVKAYRRENPGSKLKTAVTKDPKKLKKGSKDAKRRLSFCRRMKGMKKRLTSAKTARDPDSRINKALRRWNC